MQGNFEKSAGGILVPKQKLVAMGKYHGKIIRAGEVIDEFDDENLCVYQGLNDLLGVMFYGQLQMSNWYCGIFEGNYTPVNTDTGGTIAANATESIAYSGATRPAWTPAAPASQSITNSASMASFTFNATKTIYGAFLISTNVMQDTGGHLFSAAQFSTPKSVVTSDQLLLTYTFNASSV